jgi:hypothetical protein
MFIVTKGPTTPAAVLPLLAFTCDTDMSASTAALATDSWPDRVGCCQDAHRVSPARTPRCADEVQCNLGQHALLESYSLRIEQLPSLARVCQHVLQGHGARCQPMEPVHLSKYGDHQLGNLGGVAGWGPANHTGSYSLRRGLARGTTFHGQQPGQLLRG